MIQERDKIRDALSLLEEAAREKKDELVRLIGGRYQHIHDVFEDSAQKVDHVKERISEAVHEGEKRIEDAIKKGQHYFKDTIKHVDEEIHDKPVQYLTGVAVVALLVGYFWGSRKEGKR